MSEWICANPWAFVAFVALTLPCWLVMMYILLIGIFSGAVFGLMVLADGYDKLKHWRGN